MANMPAEQNDDSTRLAPLSPAALLQQAKGLFPASYRDDNNAPSGHDRAKAIAGHIDGLRQSREAIGKLLGVSRMTAALI